MGAAPQRRDGADVRLGVEVSRRRGQRHRRLPSESGMQLIPALDPRRDRQGGQPMLETVRTTPYALSGALPLR
jgi:hypothetical protein